MEMLHHVNLSQKMLDKGLKKRSEMLNLLLVLLENN